MYFFSLLQQNSRPFADATFPMLFVIWRVTFVLCLAGSLFLTAWRSYLIGVLALHVLIFVWAVFDFRVSLFMKVYYRPKERDHRIALTFDDGPDPHLTPDVLDLLRKYGVKATFFVVGSQAARHPDIVKAAIADGHTIGCHDLNHRWSDNFRLTRRMVAEIGLAADIIQDIAGRRPRLYRAPVGLLNPHLPAALNKLDMVYVGWNASVNDAGNRRLSRLCRLPSLAAPGKIVMMHDALPRPVNKEIYLAQLEKLLLNIRRMGLTPVGVDTMLGLRPYLTE